MKKEPFAVKSLNLFQQDFVQPEQICSSSECLNLSCLVHGDVLREQYKQFKKQKPPE